MTAMDPQGWTLAGLSRAVAKKKISPVEIVRACLDRIEAHEGKINSFLTVLPGPALSAARRAEKEILKGRRRGPLHGIPYALKDLFFAKGIRNTCGSKILGDFVPSYDAAVVERLSAAGAILLGKLNMHEFAFGPTSVNPHYGPVRNPWDRQRISGGSSGGSGAALACSFALLTLGTDTGGSIRIPSALCGVAGLKPTFGRISRHGVYPLCWSLDHPGPMAKSVEDLALAMNVLAGQDPRDPAMPAVPVPDYTRALKRDLKGVRLGLPDSYYFERLDPEVRAGVKKAVEDLKGLGAKVQSVSIPLLEEAAVAASIVLFAEAAASLEKWHLTRRGELGEDLQARLIQGAAVPAALYLKAQATRRKVQEHFQTAFRQVDALVTPQLPIVASPIGQGSVSFGKAEEPVPSALTRFTRIYNLAGIPALSVRCGFSRSGLPVGLQIAARPFDEETVLRVGHAYETRTSWKERQPVLE